MFCVLESHGSIQLRLFLILVNAKITLTICMPCVMLAKDITVLLPRTSIIKNINEIITHRTQSQGHASIEVMYQTHSLKTLS